MKTQRKFKQDIRNNKAITLIALVVTIVVLLILAGTSIAMLAGENGIIKQAQESKEKNKIAEIEEKVNLAAQAALMDTLNQGIEQGKFQEELDRNFGSGVANLDYDESTSTYTVTVDEYEVKVNNKGQVSEVAKSSISIKLTLSHTAQVPTVGGNVAEIREGNVPIPRGFYYVGGTKDTGIVISDVEGDDLDDTAQGNQFVWIPVNQNQKLTLDVTSETNITKITLIGPGGIETELTASGKTFTQELPMTKNGVYTVEVTDETSTKTVEKRITSLYAEDIEMLLWSDVAWMQQWYNRYYNSMEELLRDQGYANVNALLEDTGYSTLAEYFWRERMCVAGYENEYIEEGRHCIGEPDIENNQNTESVNKYGGYYIARYEAGDGTTDSPRIYSTSDTNELVSKKEAYVYNNVKPETAQILSTGMYSANTAVTSQLITGSAWDRTLNWIIETRAKTEYEVMRDSRSWGNYSNSTGNAEEGSYGNIGGTLFKTGLSEYWKANNIYDLAGNEFDMTLETWGEFSARGGYNYGDTFPAIHRENNCGTSEFYSFRVQLCINV